MSVLLIKSNVGCMIDGVCYNHLFYADDLCLLAPSAIAPQKLLNVCYQYGITHDITYNPSKLVCIGFKPSNYKLTCPVVYLGDDKLMYQVRVKYLGVILTADCSDNNEIKIQTQILYARVNLIIRRFSACSLPVKLQLFQAYCTNIYCAPLWSTYNSQVYNILKSAYNNAYQYLLPLWSIHNSQVYNNVTLSSSVLYEPMLNQLQLTLNDM